MAGYGIVELLADIEADIYWRQEEIAALRRTLNGTTDNNAQQALRRAMIALLYAHAEGGIKVAVSCYVRVINERRLKSEQCNPHLVASAWDEIFSHLADGAQRHKYFKAALPDDTKLHRFARRAEFVARSRDFAALEVKIDEKEIVDTEGNIDQVVLAKILFRLGFPPDVIGKQFSNLQYLRGLRNPIAHGEPSAATAEHCAKYEKAVFDVFKRLRDLLERAVRTEDFLRKGEAA